MAEPAGGEVSLGRVRLVRRAVLIAASLWAGLASAWPVDLFVTVPQGGETFVRFQGVAWVALEHPALASAEAFPSGEVLVNGLAEGTTLLMVYGQGRFSVWQVRVGGQPAPVASGPRREAMLKACPGAKLEPEQLVVRVPNEACRLALRAFLEVSPLRADRLDLTFELGALQSQLRDLTEGLAAIGLKDRVQLRYLGAGLVLQGSVTEAEHRRLLWEIFRRSAGRAPLEDRLVVSRPDAGTPGDAETGRSE